MFVVVINKKKNKTKNWKRIYCKIRRYNKYFLLRILILFNLATDSSLLG